MRRLTRILLAALFLSAAYLFAWPTATVPYFATVILHLIAGVLFLCALIFVFGAIWREATPISRIGWILLVLGAITGAVLIYTGTPHSKWNLLYTHIGACLAGGSLVLSEWIGKRGYLRGGALAGVLRAALVLAIAGGVAAGAYWLRTVPWERANRIENPPIAPENMNDEGDGPGGPFFPSSAQTAGAEHIPASYFTESDSCQRCHADIYNEWQGSAHHFRRSTTLGIARASSTCRTPSESSRRNGARDVTIPRCCIAECLTGRSAKSKTLQRGKPASAA